MSKGQNFLWLNGIWLINWWFHLTGSDITQVVIVYSDLQSNKGSTKECVSFLSQQTLKMNQSTYPPHTSPISSAKVSSPLANAPNTFVSFRKAMDFSNVVSVLWEKKIYLIHHRFVRISETQSMNGREYSTQQNVQRFSEDLILNVHYSTPDLIILHQVPELEGVNGWLQGVLVTKYPHHCIEPWCHLRRRTT